MHKLAGCLGYLRCLDLCSTSGSQHPVQHNNIIYIPCKIIGFNAKECSVKTCIFNFNTHICFYFIIIISSASSFTGKIRWRKGGSRMVTLVLIHCLLIICCCLLLRTPVDKKQRTHARLYVCSGPYRAATCI